MSSNNMKKPLLFSIVLFCVYCVPIKALSQQVGWWDVVDSTPVQSLYTTGRVFSAASPNDIGQIGEYNSSRFGHFVRQSLDSGRTWRELYWEKMYGGDWGSIAHPTADVFVITADSIKYIDQSYDHILHKGLLLV